ncbi:MAG: hypothetical protein AAF558_04370 [Verrucomicrobiota bacterium]
MSKKVRKHVYLPEEVVRAAQKKGSSLGDYIAFLHHSQTSIRTSHVASIYRSFALLEMARVPVDPAYFDLVDGVLGKDIGHEFQVTIKTGEPYALPKAAAALLGADTRVSAVEAIFMASARASVMHEGYIEAARLLEATLAR